ncbi:DUF6354 family protein [Streptomyces achromogenes]|uniref:DUF6354 family protein n=1 Tax=Streptomyces achromogenes TaxID=67255 RepID=UPI00367E8F88
MTDTPTPAPGQIWQDNDKRAYGRQLRIIEIDNTHAICELYTPRDGGGFTRPGRRTRIRLDRLRPTATGYRYISGGEPR